jgi:hypothetical protein
MKNQSFRRPERGVRYPQDGSFSVVLSAWPDPPAARSQPPVRRRQETLLQHFREYPLLNTPNLFLVLLKAASDGPCRVEDCALRLKELLESAHETSPVADAELVSRLRALSAHLVEARLLQTGDEGRLVLTRRGRAALEEHPAGFDTADLMAYPEFADFVDSRRRTGAPLDPHAAEYDEGFNAYRSGQRPDDNPYPAETVSHQSWENGWCEALDEDLA